MELSGPGRESVSSSRGLSSTLARNVFGLWDPGKYGYHFGASFKPRFAIGPSL
jgi:hypothetical protein